MHGDERDHAKPVYDGLVRHLLTVDGRRVEPEDEGFQSFEDGIEHSHVRGDGI